MTSSPTALVSAADPLADFTRAVAALSDASPEHVDALYARIGVARSPARWRSTLNNDGAPAEACLVLGPGTGRIRLRLIGDPDDGRTGAPSRAARARHTLARLADRCAPDVAAACSALLEHLTPSGRGAPYVRAGSDAWFAVDADIPGVAVYATARWGPRTSRWPRAFAWLLNVCPAAMQATSSMANLAAHSTLVCVAAEGGAAGSTRVKFYWRPDGTATLPTLGIPLLASSAFATFLLDATEGTKTPASAIVGSVGVSLATGTIVDVKLDLCGHCTPRGMGDWARRIERYATAFGFSALPRAALERHASIELAFIGLGIDRYLRPRLNIYLKPAVPGDRP